MPFDLLTEPWIPVLDAYGGAGGTDLRDGLDAPLVPREIGLREALLRTHEIREVAAGSPLETIALNRLLLALALDVYLPEPDPDAWHRLWDTGHFPAEPLDDYLEEWGDRFDLLNPEHPFFQRATPDASKKSKGVKGITPLAKLFMQEGSGDQSAVLFSHHLTDPPRPSGTAPRQMALNRAAVGVVTAQAYQFGGGNSKPFNFSESPLLGRAQLWIRGRSLFEALLLNAPPRDDARMDADLSGEDAPVWRRDLDDDHEYERRPHDGLLDVLTWPSRRLTLVTETAGGETVATGVYLTQGDKLDPQPTDDPLSAHVESKTKGRFPFGLRTDRAVWRDASVLFATADPEGREAPATFRWAAALAESLGAGAQQELERIFRVEGVDVFGLVNDQAKAELWRHERMPLHAAILRDPTRQSAMRLALDEATRVAGGWKERGRGTFGLRPAIRTTATYALAPPAPGEDAYPSADTNAVSDLTQSLGAEPRFWSLLEPRFFRFLHRLADADGEDARTAALADWSREVADAARDAFDAATISFDSDARHLRALAEGRARLRPSDPQPAA